MLNVKDRTLQIAKCVCHIIARAIKTTVALSGKTGPDLHQRMHRTANYSPSSPSSPVEITACTEAACRGRVGAGVAGGLVEPLETRSISSSLDLPFVDRATGPFFFRGADLEAARDTAA
jgi:hypothetical protein